MSGPISVPRLPMKVRAALAATSCSEVRDIHGSNAASVGRKIVEQAPVMPASTYMRTVGAWAKNPTAEAARAAVHTISFTSSIRSRR